MTTLAECTPGDLVVVIEHGVERFMLLGALPYTKPFAIGESAEVEIPVGALAIALGINDDIFSDNSGVLDVVVSYAEGSVSVDEAK